MYASSMAEAKPLDMSLFNHRAGYEFALSLRGTFGLERRNTIFENYLAHVDTESRGDYDGLMATCSKRSQSYASYFSPYGEKTGMPQSYAELERYYHDLVATNTYLIHREVDKLVVGDDDLFVDGIIHQLYPGRVLSDRGLKLDPSHVYQLTVRVAVFFMFDEDGLGAGEHAYAPTITEELYTPVDPDLVPAVFWNNPVTGRVEL
jgi:hypothetical protein